jgi:hypothetical protein
MLHGKPAQQRLIQQAIDGSIRTNAKCQRQNRDDSKAWLLP